MNFLLDEKILKKKRKEKIAFIETVRERIAKNIFFSPNFFTRAFNKNLKTTHSYIRAINFIEMYKKKLLSENISNELKVLILKKKIELKVLILKKKKSKNVENSKYIRYIKCSCKLNIYSYYSYCLSIIPKNRI